MRDTQGRVRPRVRRCGGRNGEWQGWGRSACRFPKKWGGRREKKGRFARKSTSFCFNLSLISKNEIFFSRKIRLFETKVLLLRLIKHNFPFIPPHCGVYIAQSRGTFPDPPAQTLFDLLNPSRLCLIPAYRNMPQRRSPSQSGDIGTTAIRAPWGLYGKKEEQRPVFLPQEKGHSLSLDNALWATPFVSCPAPMRRIRSSLIDFWGLLSEKESPKPHSEGLRGGCFCCFEVYRTAIIYNNNLYIRILQITHKTYHATPKKKNSTSLKSGKWSINQEVRRIIRPFPS